MPRRKGSKSKAKMQMGAGIGQDIWNGLKSAEKWARKTKAISKVARALDSAGVPYAGKVAQVSGQLGYGRKMPPVGYSMSLTPHLAGPTSRRGQI